MHGFVTALEWATTPATVTGEGGQLKSLPRRRNVAQPNQIFHDSAA